MHQYLAKFHSKYKHIENLGVFCWERLYLIVSKPVFILIFKNTECSPVGCEVWCDNVDTRQWPQKGSKPIWAPVLKKLHVHSTHAPFFPLTSPGFPGVSSEASPLEAMSVWRSRVSLCWLGNPLTGMADVMWEGIHCFWGGCVVKS